MLQHSLLMQCESNPREEEIPSLFWGLDPVFLAFAKLYIRDILEMKESHQVPGIYIYNGHPIRRVDILGTVISVRERETFYSYGVDDATGVINCTCWKKLDNAKSSPDPAAPSTARELSMTSQLKKLQETMEQKTKIEIGDVIRVRGYVREFRKEREICATLYYKVDDPVWNIQIARMLELPALYKRIYDQPFRNPALKEEEALNNTDTLDLGGLMSLLSEKIKEFLQEKKVQTFYQQEVETVESLQSLASRLVTYSACSNQVESKNSATSSAIHSVFKNALQLLQEKGLVFQKDGGFDKPYYVTSKDKDLHQKIYKIIKEDCQRPNHVEKGCHLMHILSCVRLNLRWTLNKAVLQQVLQLLEDQSDIVSTGAHYYVAF
ncbi:CST complex subunit STN1 isoform X1 [Cricetulus griseus]|uniref:CST complex subunit STN1 n=1 Tax=Cricetulus griseus TaxID=10029 RepID=A0A9J7JD14_CRIGR|nr:CST complex subunit STN1 isoform X1 [Cricetulus griseus]XP_027262867.1 CST complex subunit STN1 isoform X1 [Cricetulus griseus]XP_027262868.1 CST complex subunit STN1 isoform X1 [Cricetulus griseus]